MKVVPKLVKGGIRVTMGQKVPQKGAKHPKQEGNLGAKLEPSSEAAAEPSPEPIPKPTAEPSLELMIPEPSPEEWEPEAKTGATTKSEHAKQGSHA